MFRVIGLKSFSSERAKAFLAAPLTSVWSIRHILGIQAYYIQDVAFFLVQAVPCNKKMLKSAPAILGVFSPISEF